MLPPTKATFPCEGCLTNCTLVITEDEIGITVYGNRCRRGDAIGKEKYAKTKKTILCAKVKITGRIRRLRVCSDQPVTIDQTKEFLRFLRGISVSVPIKKGTVIAADVLNTGISFLADKDIS